MAHDLYPRCQKCRPNALLIVLIREVPRLAYYQVATSSIHNIVKRREKYLLHLEPDPEWVKAMLAEMHRRALPPGADRLAIPARAGGEVVDAEPTVEVIDLGDEPLWEPAEHYNGDDEGDEPVAETSPEEPAQEASPPAGGSGRSPGVLSTFEVITPEDVARAR